MPKHRLLNEGLALLALATPIAAQQTTTSLTAPTGNYLHVVTPRPSAQLTTPNGPATVPFPISQFDYDAHMAFQRKEDEISEKVDLLGTQLNGRLDGLKSTVEEDHRDIVGLKDTRSSWQGYIVVGGIIWTLVTGFTGYLNKARFMSWLKSKIDQSAAS